MFTLRLGDGERRVLDLRATRRLAVTNVSQAPIRICVMGRAEGGWVPVSGDVWLPPRRRWWRCRNEIEHHNATVEAHGSPGVTLARVDF
jgi:hypothetical protein